MELKYYLRGLGLGIVVTAIIMGIASSRRSAMTDEEIIARAKQLGMIEDRVLSEAVSEGAETSGNGSDTGENGTLNENDSAIEETPVQEGDVQDENNISDETEEMPAANDTSVTTLPDDEETGQEEEQNEPEAREMEEVQESAAESVEADRKEGGSNSPMVITVGNGDGSYTVSKKLEDVGAVASASAFDTFLCENGYDKRIRAGSYTIPADAGEDQIARMITGLE
ncbi:MAG: hypothetical protein HDR27_08685 [Lachnospiraceae bacterium]|nr:hypothetical protein [Lachnospiraceae bacterium]